MADISNSRIEILIHYPREDLAREYKQWLDLGKNEHKATLAKAAIALANHGGGYIVIGFSENDDGLQSEAIPPELPAITQDCVNEIIRRYAEPEFHCVVHTLEHRDSGNKHPVVTVPGNSVPVMARRDCDGVVAKGRCYIRKPGPRSEEPQSADEWRRLFDRCMRANRSSLLDAIRSILHGNAESLGPPDVRAQLRSFCLESRSKWESLVAPLPKEASVRFPHGWYEIGFSLIGAPVTSLVELRERLRKAQSTQLTGWPPFLDWDQYTDGQCIEAWAGRPVSNSLTEDPSVCDYWRCKKDGSLYTIRGYTEDGMSPTFPAGTIMDPALPVWRVAETILFAHRFAESFGVVSEVVIQSRFTGLNGRRLGSVSPRGWGRRFGNRCSRTDEFSHETTLQAGSVQDNIVEIVHDILTDMYALFDFFVIHETLVRNEIKKLMERDSLP